MLSFSRHILDSVKQMEEAIAHTAEKNSLRIGCSVSVGTCMINDILEEAHKKMPDCEINVLVANSSEMEAAVLENKVDIAIVEGILKSEDLLTVPICEDELVIVCGKGHALAKKEKITLDMLEGQNYISRESGSTDRNQIEKMLEEQGLHLKRTFCSTNTEAIKNAVIRGHGIAIFSKRVVEKECRKGELIILPIAGVEAVRYIHFAIHKNKYISKSIRMIQEILQI